MTHPHEETLTTAVAEAPEGQALPTESAATSGRAHAPLLTALFASTALAASGGGGGASGSADRGDGGRARRMGAGGAAGDDGERRGR